MSTDTKLSLQDAREIMSFLLDKSKQGILSDADERAIQAATAVMLNQHPEALESYVAETHEFRRGKSFLHQMAIGISKADHKSVTSFALIQAMYVMISDVGDSTVLFDAQEKAIRSLAAEMITTQPRAMLALAHDRAHHRAQTSIYRTMADGINKVDVTKLKAEGLDYGLQLHLKAAGDSTILFDAQEKGIAAYAGALLLNDPAKLAVSVSRARDLRSSRNALDKISEGIRMAGVGNLSPEGTKLAVDVLIAAQGDSSVTRPHAKKSMTELMSRILQEDPKQAVALAKRLKVAVSKGSDLPGAAVKGANALAPEKLTRETLDAVLEINKTKPDETSLQRIFDHMLKTPESRKHMTEVITKLEDDYDISSDFLRAALKAVQHSKINIAEKQEMLATIADHPRGNSSYMAYVLNEKGMEEVKSQLMADKPNVRKVYIERADQELRGNGVTLGTVKDMEAVAKMQKGDDFSVLIATAANHASGKGPKASAAAEVLERLAKVDGLVASDTGMIASSVALSMRKRSARVSGVAGSLFNVSKAHKALNAITQRLGIQDDVAYFIKSGYLKTNADNSVAKPLNRAFAGAFLKKKKPAPAPQ